MWSTVTARNTHTHTHRELSWLFPCVRHKAKSIGIHSPSMQTEHMGHVQFTYLTIGCYPDVPRTRIVAVHNKLNVWKPEKDFWFWLLHYRFSSRNWNSTLSCIKLKPDPHFTSRSFTGISERTMRSLYNLRFVFDVLRPHNWLEWCTWYFKSFSYSFNNIRQSETIIFYISDVFLVWHRVYLES